MDVGLFQISNVSKFKKEHKYVIKLITSNESSYLDLDTITSSMISRKYISCENMQRDNNVGVQSTSPLS